MLASYIKALLHKNGIHWGDNGDLRRERDMGDSATVTYSFFDRRPSGFSEENYQDFTAFSTTQRDQARAALSHYEDVANITFQERLRNGTLQFGYAQTFADFNNDGNFEPAGGLARRPSSSGGSVVIDRDTDDFTPGGWGFYVWLHELGHAVGAFNDVTMGRNPEDQYGSSNERRNRGIDGETLSAGQDSRKQTVMSYINHPQMSGVQPKTLMLYDIAALQALYGANWNHNSGNDTYSWEEDETFIETIWDGGGIDTIDASNQTRRSIINLDAGSYSSIGSQGNNQDSFANLAIAYGATIEKARGGSGNDIIYGNNVNNTLWGNAGDDYLDGSSGHDQLYGGDGDDELYGVNGQDILWGNAGNDYLRGGNYNDSLYGSGDNDSLYGDGGHDILNGGSGSDSMYGGSGNDTYYVDSSGDSVTEVSGLGGIDEVHSSVSYALGDYVENLTLISAAYRADGNSLNNTITGNRYDNRLLGGRGNDVLMGGLGDDRLDGEALYSSSEKDYLTGGGGADTFSLQDDGDIYEGLTIILDFNPNEGDKISLPGSGSSAFVNRFEFQDASFEGMSGAYLERTGISSAGQQVAFFQYNTAGGINSEAALETLFSGNSSPIV